MLKLTQLPLNSKGKISFVNAAGPLRRRLLDLGFVPGTVVEMVRRSPAGSPAVYLVRGTMIALRKEQSDNIWVE